MHRHRYLRLKTREVRLRADFLRSASSTDWICFLSPGQLVSLILCLTLEFMAKGWFICCSLFAL